MTSFVTKPTLDDTWSSLLIVAGPSGSGKTTFSQALYDHRLPSEILSVLPECLFSAPNMDPKFPERLNQPPRERNPRRTAVASAKGQGRILHYSLNRLEKDAQGHPEESRLLLRYLQSTNETVIVVTIYPDRKALAKQYGKRLFYERRAGHGPENHLNELKSMLQFLKISKIKQYFLYRFTAKVPRMYREWFSFIDKVIELAAANNTKCSYRCFLVEPYLKESSEKAFRIQLSPPVDASSGVAD